MFLRLLALLIWCGCTAPIPDAPPVDPVLPPAPTVAPVGGRTADAPPRLTPLTPGGGVVYEVYVRSFQDSDDDGIGDLAGLTTRLDYLVSLGVTTLWLMPLTPSATPDGAAVLDHTTITPEYGDTEALRRLTIEAHTRDLRVLVEAPLNAVSAGHPAFLTALAAPTSPERALFRFRSDPPDGPGWVPAGDDWYYAAAGPDLPDLDWSNPAVEALVLGAQRAWLTLGVDGFVYRDVAQLMEADASGGTSHTRLADIRAALTPGGDDVWLLAGADDDNLPASTAWLGTAAAPEATALLDAPRHEATLGAFLTADRLTLLDVYDAEGPDPAALGGFLGSDRMARLADALPEACARRAAMVVHLLSAGQPVLYYGEELDAVGASGASLPDEPWRGPMRWDETQDAGFSGGEPWFPLDPGDRHDVADELADEGSMLRLVKALADLRRNSAAARTGTFTVATTDDSRALAFVRTLGEERVVVIVNLTGDTLADLRVGVSGPLTDLTAAGERWPRGAPLTFAPVPPYSYRVLVEGVDRGHPIPVLRCAE